MTTQLTTELTTQRKTPVVRLKDTVLRYAHQTAVGMVEETVLDLYGEELEIMPGEILGIHAGGEGTFRYYHELAAWFQGFNKPSAGSMMIFDFEPPLPQSCVAKTARIFREGGVLPDFTVAGNIELALAFSGLETKEAAARVEEAMARFDLSSYKNAYPGTDDVGPGAEKRLNYARAWARRPLLLIIDQPFLHIRDSYAAEAVGAVNELAANGAAVVFTTNQAHDLLPGPGGLADWRPTRTLALDWGRLSPMETSANYAANCVTETKSTIGEGDE